MDALKIVFIFILIVIALRKNVSVGVTLFGAGLVTAILYRLDFIALLDGYWNLIKSERFISLTSVIIFITILGSLLKELEFLDKLTHACSGLPGGNRTAASILPPLVGLMPMPGGSLLSAPLVNNVLKSKNYQPEFKMIVNYWSRHVVEFFWPIYPGLILTEGITGMHLYNVSLMQFPMAVIMAIVGYLFFIRKIATSNDTEKSAVKSLWGILKGIWPILLAIFLYGILKINISLAVMIALLVLIVTARPTKKKLIASLRTGLSFKLIFLVFGVLSFQTVLELSGTIKSLPEMVLSYHLPVEFVIFSVCFTAGILTGMVAAYVGLGYTLLAGFLYQPVLVPSHIFLAYLSGYLGMFLSPTHLCLILSNEYYGSDLMKVYKTLILPVLILLILGVLFYITPWFQLFLK